MSAFTRLLTVGIAGYAAARVLPRVFGSDGGESGFGGGGGGSSRVTSGSGQTPQFVVLGGPNPQGGGMIPELPIGNNAPSQSPRNAPSATGTESDDVNEQQQRMREQADEDSSSETATQSDINDPRNAPSATGGSTGVDTTGASDTDPRDAPSAMGGSLSDAEDPTQAPSARGSASSETAEQDENENLGGGNISNIQRIQ